MSKVNTEEYDVIVVGAGPSGSMAARYAAGKAKVLVVDKHREIGSPKRCGEGLGIRGFNDFDLPLDQRFLNKDIYGANIYSPDGKNVQVRYEGVMGRVLERKIFDKFLATEAARAGAKILAESNARLWIEGGKLIGVKYVHQGEKYKAKAKVVIAADGVDSQISKQMGVNTTINPYDLDSCIEYEMAGIEYEGTDMLNLFVGTDVAPRGYIWIFPKDDDRANVGIGIAGDEKRTAKHYLDKFIAERPGLAKGSILEVNVGSVPVGGFMKHMVKDNLMIIGDAARMVNPIHGGGLYEAMLAGKLAGQAAGKAIEKEDIKHLMEYEEGWWGDRGKRLNDVLKIRNFVEKLEDDDLNYLATIWTGEDLVELSRGRYKPVFKKVVKHPKLLKLIKNVM